MRIDEAIRAQQEEIRRTELGIYQGDLTKLKARLAELFRDREEQHRQYLETFKMLEAWTAKARPKRPEWLTYLSPDEYIGPRRTLRTNTYPPRL